jgi:glycosyltransferase involved in cell wall biosynthesis
MKVLFLDQFSDFGGAQLCLRDVLTETLRRGWRAELMAPGDGGLIEFAVAKSIRVHRIPIGQAAKIDSSSAGVSRYATDLARTIRSVRAAAADLVYVNGPRVLPAAIASHKPVLFHAHSVPSKSYARAVAQWCIRRTKAAIIACSHFAGNWIEEGLVEVIYNGVPDHGFRPREALHGPLRIGIIGRISPEKGHLDFLKAAQRLHGEGAAVRFVIIGSALFSDRYYEQTIRALAAASNVEYRGWANDIAETLHSLDILAVPSFGQEASTRTILEAFSAGTPVVAYPSGGIRELVRNGENGLLVTASTADSLANTLRVLVHNPDLRTQFAVQGRKDWEARFTLERFQSDVAQAMLAAAGRFASSSEWNWTQTIDRPGERLRN